MKLFTLITSVAVISIWLPKPAQADGFKPPACSTVHANAKGTVLTVERSTFRIDGIVRQVSNDKSVPQSQVRYCSTGKYHQTVITGLTAAKAKDVSGGVCKALNRSTNPDNTCLNVSWVSE